MPDSVKFIQIYQSFYKKEIKLEETEPETSDYHDKRKQCYRD